MGRHPKYMHGPLAGYALLLIAGAVPVHAADMPPEVNVLVETPAQPQAQPQPQPIAPMPPESVPVAQAPPPAALPADTLPGAGTTHDAAPDTRPPVLTTAGSDWEALKAQAIAQVEAGKLDEAHESCRKALALAQQKVGADGVPVADSLGTLAAVYQARGDTLAAEALLRWSLGILETAYGPDDTALLRPLRGLAALYVQDAATLNSEDGLRKAGPWLERGMRIVDLAQAKGTAHDADDMGEFAAFVHNVGDGEGFLKIMQVVLAVRERTLGLDHPKVGDTLLTMADWFAWSRQADRVAPLAIRILTIHERAYGAASPEFANTLAQLRTLNFKVGDPMLAEGYGRRALDIRERALGATHPDVAEALRGLADIFERSGRPAMALQYRERANKIAPLPSVPR